MNQLTARLQVPAVAPEAVWRALSDPLRLIRWFEVHEPVLVLEPDSPGAYFRGAYHFWNFFTPHAPPSSQYVLLAMQGPDGTGLIHQDYEWTLLGHRSEITLTLEPRDHGGTLVGVAHNGLPGELPGIGNARLYWTLVLENLRLYLLGRGGLSFHQTLAPGELALGTEFIAPTGLDATATAWELLTDQSQLGLILPPGIESCETLSVEPPHHGAGGGAAARLDWGWQNSLGLPGVLSWRLAGSGSRTRITIVQSGFANEEANTWLAGWRATLGQLRAQLDLGEDWSQIETEG